VRPLLTLLALLISTSGAATTASAQSGNGDRLRTDWANLQRYAQQNRELGPPARGEHRVVFMGNSITEAWQALDSAFFVSHRYIDRGISGQTTPQMLVRFRQDVIDLRPSVVVILGGVNDIAENTGPTTLEAIAGNLVSMIELARANGIAVVLCSVLPAADFPWRHGLQPAPKIAALNDMLRSYAAAHHVVFVDYYPAMVDEHGGLKAGFTIDGVHPNVAGYRVMEPLVEQGITTALGAHRDPRSQ
jgi:lysophospholipase L1-like esterase